MEKCDRAGGDHGTCHALTIRQFITTLKIEFEQMTADGKVYSLRALHKPTGKEADKLYFLFGAHLPEDVSKEIRQGTIIVYAKHLRLKPGFTGDWVTVDTPER